MCSASQPSRPAPLPAHVRGDAQREALLAEQRVAAVAGAERPDLARFRVSGRCTCVGLHGHGTSASPARQRRADRVHAGHEVAVLAQHVEHRAAHARHDAHVDHDVRAESVISTPMCAMWRAERPHRERHHVHRAAAHAAVEQPRRAWRASRPGRPSCWSGRRPPPSREQMKVRSSTRATSPGSDSARNEFGRLTGSSRRSVPAATISIAQPVVFLLRAVAPVDAIGPGQRRDRPDPFDQPLMPDPLGGLRARRTRSCGHRRRGTSMGHGRTSWIGNRLHRRGRSRALARCRRQRGCCG